MDEALAQPETVRSYDLSDTDVCFIAKCISFWRDWTPTQDSEGFLMFERLSTVFTRPREEPDGHGSPRQAVKT